MGLWKTLWTQYSAEISAWFQSKLPEWLMQRLQFWKGSFFLEATVAVATFSAYASMPLSWKATLGIQEVPLWAWIMFALAVIIFCSYEGGYLQHARTKKEFKECREANAKLITPTLEPLFREGDNRYLIVREEEANGARLGTIYVGRFSVSNPPDRTRSVNNVRVLLKDILGCGIDFRDLQLRFEDQLRADPIDIDPGQTRFIKFASFLGRGPGREDEQIHIYHAGQDGLSGLVSFIPRAERYVAKIYISGTDICLHTLHLRFGIRNGVFYMEQSDD